MEQILIMHGRRSITHYVSGKENIIMAEKEHNKTLDLTSEYYLLHKQDKEYIQKYYNSLVNDLANTILDMKTVLDSANAVLREGKEIQFDIEAVLKQRQDYAVKTIAHMVTLLDFATYYSTPVRQLNENKA